MNIEKLLESYSLKTMPDNWADVLESRAYATYLNDTEGTRDILLITAALLRPILDFVNSQKYSRIPEDIIVRYETMLSNVEAKQEDEPGTSIPHAKWMLSELRKEKEWGKHNRWLGNIQLNLILNGYTTTIIERDFTRNYFTQKE